MVNSFDALSAREPELVKLRFAVRDFLRSDRAEFRWQPGDGRLVLAAEDLWSLVTDDLVQGKATRDKENW